MPPWLHPGIEKVYLFLGGDYAKSFFWTENLRFQNSCPLWKVAPPLENFLATPLSVTEYGDLAVVHGDSNSSPADEEFWGTGRGEKF